MKILYEVRRQLKYLTLKQGIEKTGTLVPILVTKDGVILDGRTRNRIAKELGIQIPVVILPFEVEYRDPNDLIDLIDSVGAQSLGEL